MPLAQAGPPPFAEFITGGAGGGGGGGGGLTAEADQLVFVDEGNSDTLFLRRYVKDDTGAVTGTTDTQLDGTTAYAVTGPIAPYSDPAVLTAESDQVVLYDTGTDTYFLRRYTKNAAGTVTSVTDTQLDGTTVYAETGPSQPAAIQPAGGPNVVVTYTSVTTDTTTNVAAGALAVQYYVIGDSVTVEGAAVPAGVGVTHDIPGTTTDALAVVTSGGGSVLIIEERAV